MGFEFGAARDMDAARDRPEDFVRLVAEAPFDLSPDITAANARCAASGDRRAVAVRSLAPPEAPAAAFLVARATNGAAANQEPWLVLANASLDDPVRVPLAPLLTASGRDGALAGSVGAVIGTGPGRGIGLAYILFGLLLVGWTLLARCVRPLTRFDDNAGPTLKEKR